MDETLRTYLKIRGERATDSLIKNGFDARFLETKDAVDTVLNMVSNEDKVGFGNSVSIRQIGLVDIIKDKGNEIIDFWKTTPEEQRQMLMNFGAPDVFITGTDAITLDGKMIDIDGGGNQVTHMLYSPAKIVVIAGANKVMENEQDAVRRIRNIAAPLYAMRLNCNTPCTKTGICENCDSPDRICNITTVFFKKPYMSDMTIIIVGEILGY